MDRKVLLGFPKGAYVIQMVSFRCVPFLSDSPWCAPDSDETFVTMHPWSPWPAERKHRFSFVPKRSRLNLDNSTQLAQKSRQLFAFICWTPFCDCVRSSDLQNVECLVKEANTRVVVAGHHDTAILNCDATSRCQFHPKRFNL